MSDYVQGEVLALRWNVWVSGTMLGIEKKQCITSIQIKETVEGSDSATITISDPQFLFIEDDIFVEDNTVRIMLGWSSSTYRVDFNGYISAIDINFDSNGIPELNITCMDNTHVMNRKKNNNTFKNCTSAEVVKKIVQNYGYTCVIDSDYTFTKQETITQSNQTDIDFISSLANDEVYPFTARLVGNTFYYVKMGKLETPKMILTYKKYPHDIVSFSPQINKETKQVEISSASINTGDKKIATTEATVELKNGSATSSGSPSSNSASGGYTYSPETKKWTKN